MDDLTPEQRRKNMQAIKSKDTSIECILRKELWARGFRYRKNYKKLIGKPDIVMPKYKLVIFCDSEFWHGYNWEERKKDFKKSSKKVKKVLDICDYGCYYSQALETRGHERGREPGRRVYLVN